ncbi:FMN-binding negative transcriptional regulator [Marinovum algicola]|uniref:FMN-binding negative transcriptional regulator n=1 Tax=Marinovum algicola TaxID=42444 RepID=UPI0024BAE91C|nr:FMN-binding negative transcriptional regulator [Marinovum algicola]
MHPNPAFRREDAARNLAFARARGFGVLAMSGGSGAPLLSHVPFLLNAEGTEADLHLVRSNPIARACTGAMAGRIAVSGPDSYISPDWYKLADQVPTWSYVAVHLTGELRPLPPEALWDLLDRLTAKFEEQLLPKPPWTSGKMSAGVMDKMMRMIRPYRFEVTGVDGTWKLSQNKPGPVRARAAEGVAAYGQGQELALLAALMRGVDTGG